MDCQAETNVVRIRNTLTAEASRLASAHLVMGTAGPSCSVCVLGLGGLQCRPVMSAPPFHQVARLSRPS